MVDSRLRGDWLHNPRFDDLSNEAWRLFTLAMMWSNEQGTDGKVPTRYLKILHPDVGHEVADELEAAGLVEKTADGIQFVGWDTEMGQSSAEYVARKRDEARMRMSGLRDSRRATQPREPANVPTNVPTYVGQAREVLKESPEAYVPANVRANICPKHPNGDTGEPCGTCASIRESQKPKPVTSTPPRPDPVTCKHRFIGAAGDCVICGLLPDENAA